MEIFLAFIGRVNFFTGRVVSPDMPGTGDVEIEFPGGGGIFSGAVTKSVYLGQLVEYEIDCGNGKPVLAVTYDPADQGFFKTGDRAGIDFSAPASHIPGEV